MSAAVAGSVEGHGSRQLSPRRTAYPHRTSSSSIPQQHQDQSSQQQQISQNQLQQDGPNVLSRLHALFRADTRDTDPPRTRRLSIGERLDRARTGPADMPDTLPPKIQDREAIKVFVVTWNMGDALPKGDLAVLLGTVPTYEPPQEVDRDKLPQLPIEDKHPYHIVVIAGQECPTPSGVPRGLGGVMKGMSVRVGHKKKDKEEKETDKKDDESSSSSSEDDEPEQTPRNVSPMPSTPTAGQKTSTSAQKGWSTMLDDWFCGPPIKSNAVANSPTAPSSPLLPPGSSSLTPGSPNLSRSLSAPAINITDTPSVPMPRASAPIPAVNETHESLSRHLLSPQIATSPASRCDSSELSSPTTSALEEHHDLMLPPPVPKKEGTSSLPVNSRPDRPGLIIPVTEPARTGMGTGSYVHVIKERLMGMYLSVYVYKGCEHLVQGVDKDFVTAGLAGGRLGNKGAIGISLKLAHHRFLFVNSHLAAHTKRVSARLANITKIKEELKLDTFLSKDDPRNNETDIADRFDSVFWCGDLNFRLDMSRLHAQWLVEQKNYPELLMWDQLRGVMKDPDNNPFPGFAEGPIDFPPTFKYDVWKSVRTTNRNLRRTLKRNGTVDGRRDTGAKEVAKDLAKSLSPITMEEEEAEDNDRESEYQTDSQSRPSFSSSRRSYTGTEDEVDISSEKHIDASAYGSRHKAIEVAIKTKTKKFLSYCKMDLVLKDKDKDSKRKRNVSGGLGKSPRDYDEISRRTSMSSVVSFQSRVAPPTPELPSTPPQVIPRSLPLSPGAFNGDVRRPSASSRLTASPPSRAPVRRMSILKRTVSGRSINTAETEEVHMDEDNREGVYDTSKKQRVPSWCDRVLWKAHVIPDADVPSEDIAVPREKRGSRISHVLSSFGGHIRSSIARSPSYEHSHATNRSNRSIPSTPPNGLANALVDSPTASPTLNTRALPNGPDDVFASAQKRAPLKASSSGTMVSPLSASARHPLLDQSTITASPSKPTITFDLASPSPRRGISESNKTPRPRANSDVAAHGTKPLFRQTNSAGNDYAAPVVESASLNMYRKTSHSPIRARPSDPDLLLHHAKTEHAPLNSVTSPDREEQRGAFMKFLRDLPNMLPGRTSIAPSAPQSSEEHLTYQSPRRHQKGEVVCMHYGTVDDQAMRQLEGRSDHRPAIFSAAVYI